MDETPPSADGVAGQDDAEKQDSTGQDSEGQGDALPAMVNLRWYNHAEAAATAKFTVVARRLPALILQALRLAWRAGPADTVTTLTFNLLSGVFTALGLLATTGVLEALLAAGPTPGRVRAALPSLLLVAGAGVARALLSAAAGWAEARLTPRVQQRVEMELYEVTSRIDLASYDDSEFYEALTRAEGPGSTAASEVVSSTVDMVTGATSFAAAAIAITTLHPVLLPLLLVTAVPEAWAAVRVARSRYLMMLETIAPRYHSVILGNLMSTPTYAGDLRSYTMQDLLLGQYRRVAGIYRDAQLALARRNVVTRLAGNAGTGVANGVVYAALGVLLAAAWLPLAVAGTAVLAIRTSRGALSELIHAVNSCYEEGLYLTDYTTFLRIARDHLPAPAAAEVPCRFAEITVENVSFTYPGADRPALQDVSLTLPAGQIVALVGENGSGKSTLAKLLAHLYTPSAGHIRWDGVDLATVDPQSVRSHIAVIAQDHARWPMTARANIVLAEDGDPDRLGRAAESAGTDEVVADLPRGWETMLDRRFKNSHQLSGGQWQRVAVSRGFYRDAPLIICDEPSSNLDARAEHTLFEAIRRHMHGRTVILITHRLANIRHADVIHVLENGRVTASGTHDGLMAAEGTYRDLYLLQAAAYENAGDTEEPAHRL
ncbi:ABC transporter ATP-binding protein [Actinomadura sp. DC4]|uniref:ABC transporter ATP-binding protein n=1 Tax=Actinomadura sp. DC4 TaxID=3055069 RepID=UPI0025B1EC91|nr:ABC transporter ATP-binding protein [Actinomadura sp. DC4]MDN3359618.1 ABC transporter ATP-binding protein [Actinomadura sp. DC4]